MNKLVLLLVILPAIFASPIAEVTEQMRASGCIRESSEELAKSIMTKAVNYQQTSNIELLQAAIKEAAQLKAEMTQCNAFFTAPANRDALENAGIWNLLLSNCTKDLGAVFLILDSAVTDPTDIVNDIAALIFSAILGYQGFADCGQFVAFTESLL